MCKVLYIKANTTPQENSRTYRISDSFIEEYKKNNPFDEIITLNLYEEGINLPSRNDVSSIMSRKDESSKNDPALKYAYEFAEADKYVIAAPMWNLTVPALLKAYIDYVSVSDITFKYTPKGAVGLLQGKKALNIVTRGGDFSFEPLASLLMDDRYLRAIFGFFGVREFSTVTANRLDIMGEDVDSILDKAMKEAREIAKTF